MERKGVKSQSTEKKLYLMSKAIGSQTLKSDLKDVPTVEQPKPA